MSISFRLVVVVHNIRSAHNVGSILRSADGFGVSRVYFTGYTPYPEQPNDERLPHLSSKIDRQIHKTALGAEKIIAWEHHEQIEEVIIRLKKEGFEIAALEQTPTAIPIDSFTPKQNLALVVGNEVDGLDQVALELCDIHLEIPMRGQKESFNVAVAAAVAIYQLTSNR